MIVDGASKTIQFGELACKHSLLGRSLIQFEALHCHISAAGIYRDFDFVAGIYYDISRRMYFLSDEKERPGRTILLKSE